MTSHEQGIVPEIDLLTDKAAVERTNADTASAKDQLAAWEKLDKQVQKSLVEVELSDSETPTAASSRIDPTSPGFAGEVDHKWY